MKTSGFWTEIVYLYGSQNSPVIFCMQKSVPSIRKTSLHWSQPSRVVFGCKTATYGPEKQVSMGPRHDLSLCERKTAWFASDSLVSMCPNPHLCFFFMQYSAFWTRISGLYGSQTSSVIFSTHNCELNTRIKRLYWFQPSPVALWTRVTSLYGSQTWPVVLCMQYSMISTRITCLYGSQPLSVVFACKTATFGAQLQVSMCPSSHLWFLHTQQRIQDQNFKSVRVPDFICGFEHT